jgi:hypothetical protein
MKSLLERLGRHIRTKRNFVRACVIGFGLPFGIVEAIILEPYAGPPAVVLALLLAPLAGWLWGIAMWHLWYKPFQDKLARERGAGSDGGNHAA